VDGLTAPISALTWSNSSSGTLVPVSVRDVPLDFGWYSFDATNAVQHALGLGQSSIVLALDGGPDGSQDTNRQYYAILDPPGLQYLTVMYYISSGGGVPVSAPGKMRISNGRFKSFR
jgi:hypothetical protein